MRMKALGAATDVRRLAGEVTAARALVTHGDDWTDAARAARESQGRLVSLWGAERGGGEPAVLAAYALQEGLCLVELALRRDAPSYPDLSGLFPSAGRMQRAVRDLHGFDAEGARDKRPWLRHEPDYRFVRVEGDGVHEIPVGPIHAGIIEPGHFRFSVVGEKVLRLEQRLGYTHKGVDKRFEEFTVAEGHRLAGRVSGDSTVAYAWAYAQAAEAAAGIEPPARARWLRALLLERERIANHLGDLGALGNDGGFAFALSQFMRLKEDWLRANGDAFGHRFAMDAIVPGGVAVDPEPTKLAAMARHAHEIELEVHALREIFDEHSGLQDRFITAGRITPELAERLGLVGLGGRSSGQAFDLRVDHPVDPYRSLKVKKVVYVAGDVAARVHARFDELFESVRLVQAIVAGMSAGAVRVPLPAPEPGALGVGWVEGWRGEVFVALEAGRDARIARCHAHDPSWHNWPALEHAVIGNIVPDFPLINKSFNLSYSGADT